jgi:hypothetical protein
LALDTYSVGPAGAAEAGTGTTPANKIVAKARRTRRM